MEKDIAISVKNISKTFRIPHEKVSSLRGAAVNAFKKGGYEEFKALDDVSFEVKKGEFFGIIGRNGSGKSTLLKILAGIYQTDKGKIKIDGRISPFLELGIGFNPELSGRDNVYLNATVLGMTKKQIDQKFDSIVKFSELERFIDQKLKNYSSGMQVRLAFSVSIHANREILLMDEVLAVGDSNFQAKCISEFVRYREIGKTVILVTHDLSTAQRYCDRLMLLRNGEIELIGDPQEVGSEYIKQNMSDGENEIIKNEIQEKESVSINKKVNKIKVKDLLLFNSKGEKTNSFHFGDEMIMTVEIEGEGIEILLKDNKSFNVSVSIYDRERNYIIGLNNNFDHINTKDILIKKSFTISFKNIPLINGIYKIKILLAGESFNHLYEEYYSKAPFKVTSEGVTEGIINIEHEWKI